MRFSDVRSGIKNEHWEEKVLETSAWNVVIFASHFTFLKRQ